MSTQKTIRLTRGQIFSERLNYCIFSETYDEYLGMTHFFHVITGGKEVTTTVRRMCIIWSCLDNYNVLKI
jgi:hypothetical protein